VESRNIAVIFAGGVGSRMGHPDGPKQFIEVQDKPIIVYTLEHFQNHKNIDAVYVSCLEGHIPQMQKLLGEYSLSKVASVVKGGDSAHASIYNGLQAAMEDPENNGSEAVLIHDGVRPIINNKLIDDNIDSVKKYGSSISSIPAFETVAQSVDGGKTVDRVTARDLMYVLQAPQSFRLEDIHETNRQALEDGLMGTFIDQAHMMNHYGHELHMIDGFRGNVKVTVPLDLTYFNFLVESGKFEEVTGESIG
jgi:2-C-methyl-D-erythritol 4-phosphate cytidylyltransferase